MSVASPTHRRFAKRGQVEQDGPHTREHLPLKLELCSRIRPLHVVTISCECCHLMCTFHVGHRLGWYVHTVFTCHEQDGDRLYTHKHRTQYGGITQKTTEAIVSVLMTKTIASPGPDGGERTWYFDPAGASPDTRTGRINKGAACMPPSVVVVIRASVYA